MAVDRLPCADNMSPIALQTDHIADIAGRDSCVEHIVDETADAIEDSPHALSLVATSVS